MDLPDISLMNELYSRDRSHQCMVTFVSHYVTPSIHHQLVLVDDVNQTQSLDKSKCVYAFEHPAGSGQWVTDVLMDRRRQVEYTWFVVDERNMEFSRVDMESNRKLVVPDKDRCVVKTTVGEAGEHVTVADQSNEPENSVSIDEPVFKVRTHYVLDDITNHVAAQIWYSSDDVITIDTYEMKGGTNIWEVKIPLSKGIKFWWQWIIRNIDGEVIRTEQNVRYCSFPETDTDTIRSAFAMWDSDSQNDDDCTALNMPACSVDTISHIEEALTGSLKGGSTSSIDDQLLSSAKRILLTSIDFKPAEKQFSYQLDNLRSKYISLNPSKKDLQKDDASQNVKNGIKLPGQDGAGDVLPTPKLVLYPPQKVEMEWRQIRKVGAGLINMGNTCFLNSTLQCLTYTPPLANYLTGNEHTATCKHTGFCMLCELQRHIRRCNENSGQAIRPQCILQKLRLIAKHLQWGRQEDAHEFLRYVLDAAQKSCLHGHAKLDKYSKETTVVNQIFGGYLRSQVTCQKCKAKSNTYDPFMDISLDIKNAGSIEKAFDKFVQPDILDGDNAYNCLRCKRKVSAQKNFSVHKSPNVLTVQLKRFDYSRSYGGKFTRHVHFPEKLNLRPYMSNKQGPAVMYQLYAALVHHGGSCNSGHYYSYVRAPSGMWHCMNDASVHQASLSRVMSAEAYLLFYKRNSNVPSNIQHKEKSGVRPGKINGTKLTSHASPASSLHKKPGPTAGQPSNDMGSPVSRKLSTSVTGQSKLSTLNGQPSSAQLSAKRDKVPSDIKPANQQKSTDSKKPHIVMHIKNGKVSITEKPAVKSPPIAHTNGHQETRKRKLVPNDSSISAASDYDLDNSKSKRRALKEDIEIRKKLKSPDVYVSSTKPAAAESASPAKLSVNPKKETSRDAVMMDNKLNATTSVPGAVLSSRKSSEFSSPTRERKDIMKSPRPDSPFKRIHNDGHSVSATGQAASATVNSTTNKWQILQAHSQETPSIASGSSNTSGNSTTEWFVSEAARITRSILDAQRQGWIVTPERKRKLLLSNKHGHKDLTGSKKYSLTAIPSKSAESLHETSKTSADVKRRCKDDTGVSYGHSETLSNKAEKTVAPSSSSSLAVNKQSDGDKIHKSLEKKLLKQQASHYEDMQTAPTQADKTHKPPDKFNLKKKHRENDSGTLPENRWSPKPSQKETSVNEIENIPEKSEEFSEHHGHKKKHKKHKKSHRDRSRESDSDVLRSDTPQDGSTEESPIKKHKKKKHKKDRHHDQDSSTPSCSDTDKKAHKRHSSSESESTESKQPRLDVRYESPEMTKNNLGHQQNETDSHKQKDKEKREVPIQLWDHHVKDGYKRSHTDHDLKLTTKQHWDGCRTSGHSVVQQLQASGRGYGATVSSWEGGRSTLDTEVALDRARERKRHWSDDYEEEMDKGKVKKVKHSHSVHSFGNPHNPFQGLQEWKAAEKERHKAGGHSSGHHHHHKAHHRH